MGVEYHTYFAQRIKKDGKPGAWVEHRAMITRLFVCDVCGLLGPLKKITYRSDCHGWATSSKDTLCVPCWNRVRALQNKERAILDTTRFINKVQREITYENTNNRGASELSSEHDGRS